MYVGHLVLSGNTRTRTISRTRVLLWRGAALAGVQGFSGALPQPEAACGVISTARGDNRGEDCPNAITPEVRGVKRLQKERKRAPRLRNVRTRRRTRTRTRALGRGACTYSYSHSYSYYLSPKALEFKPSEAWAREPSRQERCTGTEQSLLGRRSRLGKCEGEADDGHVVPRPRQAHHLRCHGRLQLCVGSRTPTASRDGSI